MNTRSTPQSIGEAVVHDLLEAGLISTALAHTARSIARAAVATHLLATGGDTDPAPPPPGPAPELDEDDGG